MSSYLECDWCAARIELKAEYSADEYNRMGLEDTLEGEAHIVVESRVAGSDRHGYRKNDRRIIAHFHNPDCYLAATKLLRDHQKWTDAQGELKALPEWDGDEFEASTKRRATTEARRADWEQMRRRAAAGTSISSLGLAHRASNAIWQAGIATVEALADWAEIDVLALDGVGGGSLERVKEAMAGLGVEFRSDVVGPVEFGQRLRMLRETSGLTTSDISRALRAAGVTDDWQAFTQWQGGRQIPTEAQRAHLARVLGVDVDELIRREATSR